ncbi:MAG: hypothetical protein WBL67_17100 [Nitrososphaeraceae archaeon]
MFRCTAVTAIRIAISSFTAMWGGGSITTRLTARAADRRTTTYCSWMLAGVRAAAITLTTTNLTGRTADIPAARC